MAILPQLTTPRCILETLSEKHLTDRYVSWLNDPETVRFSRQRSRRHDIPSCRAYIQSFEGTPHYAAAIVARDPVIGHIGNMNAYVDTDNGTADVGILVGERTVWGKGYAVEAWTAFCRFLLHEVRLRKITAGTIAPNEAMMGVMRRSGMREDGRRIRQMLHEGREVDVVYAAFFPEDLKL
jgi:[ribosomal protein S5]-alanine N-acetyltransferase